MADPQTINTLLNVPLRGSNPGTWDLPVNFDFTAIDGLFGGVGNIGLSNANVSLTAPAGAAVPGAGPYQSQNRVLRFTGALSANVVVTLPLATEYICENFTTGNFTVVLRAIGSGEVVGLCPGARTHVYCDGTNVRFVYGLADRPAALNFQVGYSTIVPPWIVACSVKPYLVCDGSIYNFSDYPYLGPIVGSVFGGNGITTFGTPDLRGRLPLAYDGTGTRITAAGCGINGQALGASLDAQTVTLLLAQIPSHAHGVNDPQHNHGIFVPSGKTAVVSAGESPTGWQGNPGTSATTNNAATGITIQNSGGGGAHNNVQPSLVTGIWLIKT